MEVGMTKGITKGLLLFVVSALATGLFLSTIAAGRPNSADSDSATASAPAVFTAEQAQAGQVAYERTCGKCHTYTVMGRKGDPGEMPPLSSLSASYQKFIGPQMRRYVSQDLVWQGFVPPLAGKVFIGRWGAKTAAQLIARFQETVNDPYFQFEGINDEFTVNLTAYILQVNGAKAGTEPLTRTTEAIVSSVTR
jgi:hypothetical protein